MYKNDRVKRSFIASKQKKSKRFTIYSDLWRLKFKKNIIFSNLLNIKKERRKLFLNQMKPKIFFNLKMNEKKKRTLCCKVNFGVKKMKHRFFKKNYHKSNNH